MSGSLRCENLSGPRFSGTAEGLQDESWDIYYLSGLNRDIVDELLGYRAETFVID